MPSIDAQISAFPIAAKKPTGSFTGAQGVEAMINARRLQTMMPAATAATLADAILMAGSDLNVDELIATQEYTANAGGGNTYRLLDAGNAGNRPVADNGHIVHVGSNGLYLKGLFVNGVWIEQFGDTTDPVVLAHAIAYAVAAGKTLLGGEIVTTSPLILQSGLSLQIKQITNTAATSVTNGVFTAGDFDMPESSARTYYPLNDVVKGRSEVTLTNSGDAANFSPGMLVFVRAGSFYYSDGNKVCALMQLNEIRAINGAVISLCYPLPRSASSAELCQCDDVAIKNVNVQVGRVLATHANPAKLFKQGGGVLRSVFQFQHVSADSIFFTNAFTGCTLSAESCEFTRHVYEMATGSYGNTFSIESAEMISAGVSGKRPFRISESAAFNRVFIGELNLNAANVDTSALHYIEGYDNTLTIGKVLAEQFTGDIFRFISAGYTYTGTPHYIENNHITVHTVEMGGSVQDLVHFEQANAGYLRNNSLTITDTAYGAPTGYAVRMDGQGNAVRGGLIAQGGILVETSSVDEVLDVALGERVLVGQAELRRHLYHLRLPATRDLKALRERKGYASLINGSGTETVIFAKTLLAGTLLAGDVIHLKSYGELLGASSNAGTTGTHEVVLRVNGAVVSGMLFNAGQYGQWQADFDVYLSSVTALQYAGRMVDTVYKTSSGGLSIPSAANNDLLIELVAVHAASNADRFRLRFAEFVLSVD